MPSSTPLRPVDDLSEDTPFRDRSDPSYQLHVHEQWTRFQNALPVESTHIPDMILRSWERCRAAGVKTRGVRPAHVPPDVFQQALSLNADLLESGRSLMSKLFAAISSGHSTISLTDSRGIVLHVVRDEDSPYKSTGVNPGQITVEAVSGTSGIGTCLQEKTGVSIIAAEHFCEAHQQWSCSASPIFGVDGSVIGALSISQEKEFYHPHTHGLVETCAYAIGEQLRLRQFIGEQQTTMELLNEGIIILDSENRVRSMNRKALSMLGFSTEPRSRLLRDLVTSELLETALGTQERIQDQEAFFQITESGTSLHCILSSAPIGPQKGRVLTLRGMQRMHNFVNRMTGAKAVYTFENIIGSSSVLARTVEQARVAAQSDITTLILGESGTGKELFAQSIHNAGTRRNAPFVVVNCGALPRNLVESELFGYDEGTFTGGSRLGKPGKFELADEGTIFLDEIGEMPLEAQVSLLRLLQNGEVTRVGGKRTRHVNVRVIAATNRNLVEAVRQNMFREDLYYRLNVFTLNIPPLRDRLPDIPALVHAFIPKFATSLKKNITGISEKALGVLQEYPWPGNVRELENVIERTVNLTVGDTIRSVDLPPQVFTHKLPAAIHANGTLAGREAENIIAALRETRGNMRAAAQLLGISRGGLYVKIGRMGISPDDYR